MLPKLKRKPKFVEIFIRFIRIQFHFPFDNSEMDKQKTNLLDAYIRKAIALGKINLIELKQSEADSTKKATAVADDIETIYAEVGKFTDYFDQKVNS